MPPVVTQCPSTGKPVEIGSTMTKEQLEQASLPPGATMCPHCGQKHEWTKEDLYIEEEY
jgi:hypothetical protein